MFVFHILIICVIIGTASYVLLQFLAPYDPVKDGFLVTINGQVNAKTNDTKSYPTYVTAYYPFGNLDHLASSGNSIDLANINWDGNIGNFSMTFWLPIEMNLVLTAASTGCNHERVYVSKKENVKQVELAFDERTCYKSVELANTEEQLVDVSESLLVEIFNEYKKPIYTPDESDSMREDEEQGGKQLEQRTRENDGNKSLMYAYNAYWLAWRGHYKMYLFKLGKCVDKSMPFLTENESCINIPYESKKELLDANHSYGSLSNSWVLSEDVTRIKTVQEASTNAKIIFDQYRAVEDLWENCENSFKIINESYNNQKPVCDARKNAIRLFGWAETLALICLGFLVSYPIKKWLYENGKKQ